MIRFFKGILRFDTIAQVLGVLLETASRLFRSSSKDDACLEMVIHRMTGRLQNAQAITLLNPKLPNP